jgi:hypothetical protein
LSTIYPPEQLIGLAKLMEAKRPPTPDREIELTAPLVLKFASYGDDKGLVVRFHWDDDTERTLDFHPLIAWYLSKAIDETAKQFAWSGDGETICPLVERRWEQEWAQVEVATPDPGAFDQSSLVLAVNTEGSKDFFFVTMVLDSGQSMLLRTNPLVAWELSADVHDVGMTQGWWSDLAKVLPECTLN